MRSYCPIHDGLCLLIMAYDQDNNPKYFNSSTQVRGKNTSKKIKDWWENIPINTYQNIFCERLPNIPAYLIEQKIK